MAAKTGVATQGIRDLQRDLKAIDRALPRELNKSLREALEKTVVPRAKELAPVRSGRLRDSIRAGGGGSKLYVRSNLPYAAPIHWGWRARGIKANPFIQRAVDEKAEDLVEALGDAVEDLAARHGFRHR